MLGTGYVQTTMPRGRSIQSLLFTEGKNTLWIILSQSPIKSRSVGQQPPSGGSGAGRLGGGGYEGISLLG
jgi:hypothetical protein